MATNGSNTNSNGQSDVQFAATPAIPGVDKISNANMNEIVKRLQGFVGGGITGAVSYGPVPPQDKSLLWDPGDGNIYRYDPDTGQWVTGNQNEISYPGMSMLTGNQISDPGDGLFFEQQYPRVVTYDHTVLSVGAESIVVPVNPVFFNADYIAVVVPLYDAPDSSWYEVSRAVGSYSIVYTDTGWVDPSPATFDVRVMLMEKLTSSNYTAP